MKTIAKVFQTGRSQAVRLPAAFRFDVSEVEISKDPTTGNVILSQKPDWEAFIQRLNAVSGVPDDFLSDRDTSLPQERAEL